MHFWLTLEQMWVYVMIIVWPSGSPAVWIYPQTLTLDLFCSYGTEHNQTLYAYNHHGNLCTYTFVGDLWPLSRSQVQHLCKMGRLSISGTTRHQDVPWCGYKVHQVYVTYTSFVRLFCIQEEIIDVDWNLSEP